MNRLGSTRRWLVLVAVLGSCRSSAGCAFSRRNGPTFAPFASSLLQGAGRTERLSAVATISTCCRGSLH